MKIIQIMPEFGMAGAEIMCENLVYELCKQGHQVIVVSMYDYHSAITERLEQVGIDVRYLNKKCGLDFSMITKMKKIFRTEKPDVIHTHRYVMQYAVPAAILAGVKRRVHTVHNIASKEVSRKTRKINKLFYKYAHVKPVALSESIKETIVCEYKLSSACVDVVYNGIRLDKCIIKQRYLFQNDKISLIHVGRFSEAKNHFAMIDAICLLHERYSNLELKLFGEGELQEQIAAYISKCNATSFIKLCGVTDNIYPYLSLADIFILPSLYEGMPITIVEAMASAMPIVVSDVGGVPDMVIDGEHGLLCKPNSKDIAQKIEMMIMDEALRRNCGQKALLNAKRFSAKTMAEEYSAIYERE